MLYDLNGKPNNWLPPNFNKTIRAPLGELDFSAIVDRINESIDEGGSEIATAGWMPGSDWSGTPFQPIYDKSARGNFDLAAKQFGILVWYTVQDRDDAWSSGRYEVDGRDIGSRTYFRITLPTSR